MNRERLGVISWARVEVKTHPPTHIVFQTTDNIKADRQDTRQQWYTYLVQVCGTLLRLLGLIWFPSPPYYYSFDLILIKKILILVFSMKLHQKRSHNTST